MPNRDHLRRLRYVWVPQPIYFVTVCTEHRRKILTRPLVIDVLSESWRAAAEIHGWAVGCYVVMPDHVHFFTRARFDAKPLASFMRDWKKWTTRQITLQAALKPPIWQYEFFDHVLRSPRSYSEKWDYVRNNPVRAGLVEAAEGWPYAGECVSLQV